MDVSFALSPLQEVEMARFMLFFNTSTIRPAPLMNKIRAAGAAGYEAIELWNDDLTAFEASGGTLAEVRRALDGEGLRPTWFICPGGWMPRSPPIGKRC